jgi:hypothetical protein
VTRGGDGSLFVLVKAADADGARMLGPAERAALYADDADDVVSGAGLANWSKTTAGVISGRDATGRYAAGND